MTVDTAEQTAPAAQLGEPALMVIDHALAQEVMYGARTGYEKVGRGLVLVYNDPEGVHVRYIPRRGWIESPMPGMEGDLLVPTWLEAYDPARQFILITVTPVPETDDVMVRPHLLDLTENANAA